MNGMSKAPSIGACIPAFNEERATAGVVLQAQKYADEVVACDEGSGDLTGEIAEGLRAVVLRHERNMGYGASLQSLFAEALRLGADVVVTLDGPHNQAEKGLSFYAGY